MRKRLLLVSVDFLPNIGGISMMLHHLANALASAHDVSVLAPAGARLLDELPAAYRLIEDAAANPKVREGPGYPAECRRIGDFIAAEHKVAAIDAIILLHPFYYGLAALDKARELGIPIGCYFHGFELRSQLLKSASVAEQRKQRARAGEDLRYSTLVLLHEADAIFVNSSVTGELVASQGRRDYCVTGCGLDAGLVRQSLLSRDEKAAQREACRVALGFDKNLRNIAYFGRITPSKNLEFLVDMLVHMPDWGLAIAGAVADQAYMDDVLGRARDLGVEDRIVLPGELSEEDKWRFFTAIDCFCLASRLLPGGQMEGFGIVLLEATLKGAPVAVSTQGGMRDFVLDNNGLYLDIADARASAQTVIAALDDEPFVCSRVENAQRLLRERLTYEALGERLLGFLEASA